MFEFLVIVAAILVAQVIGAIIGTAIIFNPKTMKWYAKKAFEMTKTIEEEMEALFEKEGL